MRMVILQLVPTIVELLLVMGVLFWQFDWRYVLVVAITVVVYMYYTYLRDRVAHRHPPQHERVRYRGEYQGDRLCC